MLQETPPTLFQRLRQTVFWEYAEALVWAVVLALVLTTFIVQAFKIPSGSMLETLQIGDHLLVNKFLYGLRNPFTDEYIIRGREPQVGDIIDIDIPTKSFGRIAAQTAKQVIIQGIREAERGMVISEFESKEHEILNATVARIDPRSGNAYLDVVSGGEKSEAILAASEQVRGETLVEGQHVKVYLIEVRRGTRGVQVIVSRTHPGLVKRLFELHSGVVEVKSIAREAGNRTKIAVTSHDENVDPIGACVGTRGARVSNITAELNGEKIDIIKWNEDTATFVSAALAPADVISASMQADGKSCRVIVPDDQLSLAIGKEGQNARLAAKLTGCKIDIAPQSQAQAEPEAEPVEEPQTEPQAE